MGSALSATLGGRLSVLKGGGMPAGGFLADFEGNFVNGALNATARRMFGLGEQDWSAITTDAFGNALGNAAVKKIQFVMDSRRLKEVISSERMTELGGDRKVKVLNGTVSRSPEEIAEARQKWGLSKSEYRVFADLLDGELQKYEADRAQGLSHSDAIADAAPLLSQNPNSLRYYRMQVVESTDDEVVTRIIGRVSPNDLQGAVFVNGILNDRQRAADLSGYHMAAEFEMDAGDTYYLVHNPTQSAFADLWESLRDKVGWTTDAAREVAGFLESASADGRKLEIVAHSQAGAMVTEGIRVASNDLGHQLNGISITYHSGANNKWVTSSILDRAGVSLFGGLQAPGYRYAPNDLVPQVAGMNWIPNPINLVRSILDAPLLFSGGTSPADTVSPHTYPYHPNESLYPKLPMP